MVFWHWTFDDNSTFESNNSFATHVYSTPAFYNVTLTVLDNGNSTGSVSHFVQVSMGAVVVAVNTVPGSPTIQNATTVTGNFTIEVDVVNGSDLFAWQFSLSYNRTLVSTSNSSISVGPFWQSVLTSGQGFLVKNIYANGTIVVAFTLLGAPPTPTGTGVLASVSFTPLNTGAVGLHLSNTILLDSSQHTIPSTAQSGSVFVSLPDEPPVASFTFTPTTLLSGIVFSSMGPAVLTLTVSSSSLSGILETALMCMVPRRSIILTFHPESTMLR